MIALTKATGRYVESECCASVLLANQTQGDIMTALSVVGLGAMGGALARAFQKGGHDITVWNRTADKMKPFVANGAISASSIVEAVRVSPVILVCVHDYATTRNLLGAEHVASHLPGRTLIQVGTGTPQEVQESADWFNGRGATYLDGAILCLPAAVGTDDAHFLFSGPESAFRAVEPLFECLGGRRRYIGENVRAAATVDLAWLSQRFGQIIGAIHGVCLCESEDVVVEVYEQMFPVGDRVQILLSAIKDGSYANPDVTVRVWNGVSHRLQKQASDRGINSEFPDFTTGVVARAMRAGFEDEDVAALIKILRNP